MILPSPALYAAIARYQSSKSSWRYARYVAAARVAFSGSLRSSTTPLDFRPYSRPVRGMNCQMPCAALFERACGRNEDSMNAIQRQVLREAGLGEDPLDHRHVAARAGEARARSCRAGRGPGTPR